MSRSRYIGWQYGRGLKWLRKHREKRVRQCTRQSLKRRIEPIPASHRHSERWDRW